MKVLIVEDEALTALDIQNVLEDLGCSVVGVASDSRKAREIANRGIDLAMVDLNLRDGPTGPELGAELAARGVTVLFMTANPEALGEGIPGAIGVLPKPAHYHEMKQAAAYATAVAQGLSPPPPPKRLTPFNTLN